MEQIIEIHEFTESQKEAFDLVTSPGTGFYFLKGSAGTGKSYLVNRIVDHFGKQQAKILIAAPTGVAAIKIGGQTVHQLINLLRREYFLKPDLIVVDEVSMCRADLFDELIEALGTERLNHVKLLLVGDLAQLPPVVSKKDDEYKYLEQNYLTPYFFSSFGFYRIQREFGWKVIELLELVRQSDPIYIAILNAVRGGRKHPDTNVVIQYLNDNCIANAPSGVFLTGTNRNAEGINKYMLSELKGETGVFKCSVSGSIQPYEYPAEETLQVKAGARVMVVKNIYSDYSTLELVNGDAGEVIEWTEDTISVKIDRTQSVHTIGKNLWEKDKITFDKEKNELTREPIASFSQIPLCLAWAITIHKSQGATLEQYTVDLSSPLFAEGQLYVALSRGKSLEGMKIIGKVRLSDIMIDDQVVKFLNDGETGVGVKPGSRWEKKEMVFGQLSGAKVKGAYDG